MRYPGCLLTLVLVVFAGATQAAEPDWRAYEALLQRYVAPGTKAGVALNLVDYAGLARDPALAGVVRELAAFPLENLASPAESLAFHINAYNILALKMVVDHWPLESIRDVGNIFSPVWKRTAGSLGGESVTLDDIEHARLREMGDPRMHFAIVCASVSCPDLRTEPYRADELDTQLDQQVTDFLNNPGKGLRVTDGRAAISKIFKWFDEDFEAAGGVAAFIRRYHDLPAGMKIRPAIDYNWSVNAR